MKFINLLGLLILIISLGSAPLSQASTNSVSQILWSEDLLLNTPYVWSVLGLQGKDAVETETGETVAEIVTTDSEGRTITKLETGTYTLFKSDRRTFEISIFKQLPTFQILIDQDLGSYVEFLENGIQKTILFDLFALLIFPTRFISNTSKEYNLMAEISNPNSEFSADLYEILSIETNDSIIVNPADFQINGDASRQYSINTGVLEFYIFENQTHKIEFRIQGDRGLHVETSWSSLPFIYTGIFILTYFIRKKRQLRM